ncbi:thioredoxin [Mesorhizobium sp. 1B3]|uniref:thioredoxin n=1 Tax=Mesorhizobium sp. 1B3 TaxID=3243599 RepID=UPI003D994E4D
MDDKNNPYASNGGYAANVQFGATPAASPQPAKDLIKDTTTATFAADVIQESRVQPVLVDFWAPWCGPCKQLTPVLEKAVQAAGGRVKLVKMNTEEHPAIAGQLGIQSIPAVIAFKNGQPVDGFMGAVPESQVRDFIQRVGGKADDGAGVAEALAAAAEARAAGDPTTAAEIYSALMEQAPETLEAIAGLAELMFEAGNVQGALAVLDGAPADKKDAPVLSAVRAKISLAEQAASLGEAAEFERRLAADPGDHQARFDLAMIQNAEDKRMEAADNLLAIVKADRAWQEDGARAQLLKFFEAWGPTDEVTLAARRKLSSILFS